ncbi:MAG: pur operon repressor [Dethiosulfovibrio peptidovorans]|nr:MAG: pur operon repressor [Dethiosulfovibrio peptidovorans]
MKGQRISRLLKMTARFLSNPAHPFSVTALADDFTVSKTVVSEDISIIEDSIVSEGLGRIRVDRGRAGGAAFVPAVSPERREDFLDGLARELSKDIRLLPSGLIYYSDILFNPEYARTLGLILASDFYGTHPDVVVTSEVKGIPLGIFAAQALGVPLAVCRFRNRASDGPAVCVHFATQTGDVRAMYMGTKVLGQGCRVLVIDDFMRGGGTASGMSLMVHEFKAELVGIGVFLVALDPPTKAVKNYSALLRLDISGQGPRVWMS